MININYDATMKCEEHPDLVVFYFHFPMCKESQGNEQLDPLAF